MLIYSLERTFVMLIGCSVDKFLQAKHSVSLIIGLLGCIFIIPVGLSQQNVGAVCAIYFEFGTFYPHLVLGSLLSHLYQVKNVLFPVRTPITVGLLLCPSVLCCKSPGSFPWCKKDDPSPMWLRMHALSIDCYG